MRKIFNNIASVFVANVKQKVNQVLLFLRLNLCHFMPDFPRDSLKLSALVMVGEFNYMFGLFQMGFFYLHRFSFLVRFLYFLRVHFCVLPLEGSVTQTTVFSHVEPLLVCIYLL